jgi:hypothetical protein
MSQTSPFGIDPGELEAIRFASRFAKLDDEVYTTIRGRNRELRKGENKYEYGKIYKIVVGGEVDHLAQLIGVRKRALGLETDESLYLDTGSNSREEAYGLLDGIYGPGVDFREREFYILTLRKVGADNAPVPT